MKSRKSVATAQDENNSLLSSFEIIWNEIMGVYRSISLADTTIIKSITMQVITAVKED